MRLESIDLGEKVFSERPELKEHLAWASFVALAKRPREILVIDRTLERRAMKSGFLLSLSYAFSKHVKKLTHKDRVGIVFPPGVGSFIANLSVVLAGKVPVNLNFTLGVAAIESCIENADIDCVLSTAKVRAKLSAFPWHKVEVCDVVTILRNLPKFGAIAFLLGTFLLPARFLAKLYKIPKGGGDREAALLFTSGSSGSPKGVVLTHQNILANCAQIGATELLPRTEILLSNLPVFHSFGFTVGLWCPVLLGCQVVTTPSPLEVKKTIEAISEESATLLLGTPTFLRPYLTKAKPEQMKSIRYVVAGAEKTPSGFAEKWESTFESLFFEGYGLTEMSPVVAMNLPSKPMGIDYPGDSSDGHRAGSVGRPLVGHKVCILNPDTREPLYLNQVGLIALKGPNVFSGYLNNPDQSAAMMHEGWLVTGDLGRIDEDGFIYIEGRLSRFSKIAGEMVPHGLVEETIIEAFGFGDAELPVIAIGGRPDAKKGEVLVLLTTVDLELNAVCRALADARVSNLWFPKVIKHVEEIPVLATGKLDLRQLGELSLL